MDGTGDARRAVREGLRRMITSAGLPPDDVDAARAWCNRLLDEVGSDRRGLVQLLLRVRADGVLDELPVGHAAPAAWAPVRARVAFAYAAATYLDADMARWAVDAWAYALGVIGEDGLWAPPAPAPAVAVPASVAPATPGRATVAVPARAATAPAVAAPAPAARPARVPGRVRRAAARANAGPVHNPFPANFDRLAGGFFIALVVLAAGGMWLGIVTRREAGGLELAASPGARAEPLPPAASAALGPVPARGGAAPSAPARGSEGIASEDTLRMRDGTVRTGRVARITHEAVLLHDLWADTITAVDLDDVIELRARGGAVLPLGGSERAAPTDLLGRPVPDRPAVDGIEGVDGEGAAAQATPAQGAPGYGGRYAVRQHLVEVRGTESCDVVAAAVRRAERRPTVEVVAHAPGSTAFTLVSRPGVRGTVDPDGRFRTEAIRGVRDGVHYWFRMTGQFDARGFRAETESATDAVLKYGSVQRCRVSAALDARRLP